MSAVTAVLLTALLLTPVHGFADSTYGVDNYGACDYQNCTTNPTKVPMPSGLDVSVNLTEGQTIPRSGYTIIVTPLNGADTGASITQVGIYIDDVLAQTATPDETGTIRWQWDPVAVAGTTIKLVITGSDGSVVTKIFHVTIGNPATGGHTSGSTDNNVTANSGIGAIAEGVRRAYNGIKHFVGTLPKPIVYSFPYALFVLLGVNILVLLWQAARELKQYRTWQQFIDRERVAAEAKQTLFQLIAHYFRTPITVLLGGIDLLDLQGAPVAAQLKTVGTRLHNSIEALITQTRETAEPKIAGADYAVLSARSLLRHVGLVLPVLLAGVVLLVFDLLVNAAGRLNVSQVNLGMQLVIFVLLAILTYVVYRNLQLRHRDADEQHHIYLQEQAIHQASDELLSSMVATLRANITDLQQLISQLPDSKSSSYIIDGKARLQELLTKLAVADQLSNIRQTSPPTQVKLDDLLQKAWQPLSTKAGARGITIETAGSAEFLVRSPELCAFALQSVLDNAITYSPNKAAVRVAANQSASGVSVTVTDSGEGIPKQKLPLLFQPFSKAEGAEVFTHEGMGFSLYLDKLIMHYLGGSIDLTSEEGHGTVVTLFFAAVDPMAPVQAMTTDTPLSPGTYVAPAV